MSEPTMPWHDLVTRCETNGLLAKQLYVVFSDPTGGLAAILENFDEHIAYQTKLERDGIMFAAGPFASDDEQQWHGEGMFVYRADSIDEARRIADDDPMHSSGARSYRVRSWLLNEGAHVVRFSYSDGKVRVE